MKKYRRLGLKIKDFKTKQDYKDEVKLIIKHGEEREYRKWYAKQLTGTIFAHEGDEGQIL